MTTLPPPTLDDLSDEDLARRVARNVEPDCGLAYTTLYQRRAPGHFAYLLKQLRHNEDASDALQETWFKILRALQNDGTFDRPSFRAWAVTILNHEAANVGRRRIRNRNMMPLEGDGQGNPIDPPDRREARPDGRLVEDEQGRALAECMKGLSKAERRIAEARLGGMTNPEIAERINTTAVNVSQVFHRAKTKLKACLERSER